MTATAPVFASCPLFRPLPSASDRSGIDADVSTGVGQGEAAPYKEVGIVLTSTEAVPVPVPVEAFPIPITTQPRHGQVVVMGQKLSSVSQNRVDRSVKVGSVGQSKSGLVGRSKSGSDKLLKSPRSQVSQSILIRWTC